MDLQVDEIPFLREVYSPPDGRSRIDLCFIHGLNPLSHHNHAYDTWTHENGTFWPRDLLPQDIPEARIFVYGYNSNIAIDVSEARIKHHADVLLDRLQRKRKLSVDDGPIPIIFIGHSLGGLVIKQALLNAQDNKIYDPILRSTFGLVFFGTPHRGGRHIAVGHLAARIAKFISGDRAKNDLLECLKYNSVFTQDASERFSYQLERYRVVSFFETKPMRLGFKSEIVVEEDSAVLNSGNRETREAINADHSAMCKIGKRSDMYEGIIGKLKDMVDEALEMRQPHYQGHIDYLSPGTRGPKRPFSAGPKYSVALLDTRGDSPYHGESHAGLPGSYMLLGSNRGLRSEMLGSNCVQSMGYDPRAIRYSRSDTHLSERLKADDSNLIEFGCDLQLVDEIGYEKTICPNLACRTLDDHMSNDGIPHVVAEPPADEEPLLSRYTKDIVRPRVPRRSLKPISRQLREDSESLQPARQLAPNQTNTSVGTQAPMDAVIPFCSNCHMRPMSYPVYKCETCNGRTIICQKCEGIFRDGQKLHLGHNVRLIIQDLCFDPSHIVFESTGLRRDNFSSAGWGLQWEYQIVENVRLGRHTLHKMEAMFFNPRPSGEVRFSLFGVPTGLWEMKLQISVWKSRFFSGDKLALCSELKRRSMEKGTTVMGTLDIYGEALDSGDRYLRSSEPDTLQVFTSNHVKHDALWSKAGQAVEVRLPNLLFIGEGQHAAFFIHYERNSAGFKGETPEVQSALSFAWCLEGVRCTQVQNPNAIEVAVKNQ